MPDKSKNMHKISLMLPGDTMSSVVLYYDNYSEYESMVDVIKKHIGCDYIIENPRKDSAINLRFFHRAYFNRTV